MAYTRTTWQEQITALSAANMNNIEDGVLDLYTKQIFKTRRVASQSITGNTVTSVLFDTNDITCAAVTHSTSSNKDQIVINEAGTYLATGQMTIPDPGTAGTIQLWLNAAAIWGAVNYADSSPVAASYVYSFYAAAGDIIRSKVWSENNSVSTTTVELCLIKMS